MVPGDLIAAAATLGWPLDDVDMWTVVPLHVQIHGDEPARSSLIEVPGDGQRLEKDLRHDDGASNIEYDAPVVDVVEGRRESPKIPVTGRAQRRAVGGRVLMDDLGADGRVHSDRDVELPRGQLGLTTRGAGGPA